MVGVTGFEPTTSWSRTKHATICATPRSCLLYTSCIGAFLGSALALAGTSGTAVKGVLLLVTYSLGLGAPFLLSALLIEKLNTAFTFIKKHYRVINIVCGCFLILVGILMACGLMDAITAVFS